ncbi:hypothetical protein [Bdellovibrio sp. BCCA]|uniref:hypothetical protein n=1 Tax=Bdellovibrio sp. BCCA TaxID=3136281 RepID=UPI0030F00E66
MKKIIFSVLLLSTMFSVANATETNLMNCRDRYFSIFSAKQTDGKIFLRLDAAGYADRLELADKLGLPPEKAFNRLDMSMPKENCSWAKDGRLSCLANNLTLVFRNFNGDVEVMTVSRFTLNTGEMGVGSSSYRRVEVTIERDEVVTDSKGYPSCSGEMSR